MCTFTFCNYIILSICLLSPLRHVIKICESYQQRVVVAGATGYIGRNMVKELVQRGIPTASLVRSLNKIPPLTKKYLEGSEIIVCDVLDKDSLRKTFDEFKPTAAVCCLASRSGVAREAWTVDYQGGYNVLEALKTTTETHATDTHYVLLSAFCVGKPLLQFQFAKIKLEKAIQSVSATISTSSSKLTYSIVRPTAFFKSLDGQIESVQKGNPIIFFGPGTCSANAISDEDLACFMSDCVIKPKEINMENAVRNIGGPDIPPVSKLEQGHLIYDTLKIPSHKRKFISIPYGLLDFLINTFATLEKLFSQFSNNSSVTTFPETLYEESDSPLSTLSTPTVHSYDSFNNSAVVTRATQIIHKNWFEKQRIRFEDATEIVRIIKYYASEPMVCMGEEEIYGKMTLKDHFLKISQKGGQLEEIDKMTTTTGILESFAKNDYVK